MPAPADPVPCSTGAGRAERAGRRRSRPLLLLCLAATVSAGLLSRRHALPGVFAEHTGDALYTVAVFVALALVAPRRSGLALAALAWLLSALVELSQLLTWQWLTELRRTSAGALLLGQGWKGNDLIAYAAGALVALLLDAIGASLRRVGRTRRG